jgi:integral membrane protein (TIGR00529 family)
MTALKLLAILIVIVFGIKRKIFVGYLLLGAGVLVPFLFGFGPLDVVRGVGKTLLADDFWRLFGAIVIITFLGHLLKELGSFDRLTDAAQALAGGKKTAALVLPAIMGLMPMPGGALMSAPLIEEVLKDDRKSPAFLTAVNYWFRHIMEFFWPLYPGVILIAGITGITVRTFSQMGVILSLSMLTVGYFFFLRQIPTGNHTPHTFRSLGQIGSAIWPVFLAVAVAMIFSIDVVIALILATAVTIAVRRASWPLVIPVFRSAINLRLFFMVFGILVFKDMLELSGAVAQIPAEISRVGIPPVVVIFILPFLCGLLSGMVSAFVGLSFPILAGFLYLPQIQLSNIFLAYLSGYLGMILSPTHFCLLLTAEHFRADLGSVYRVFAPALAVLACIGVTLFFLGYPWSLLIP